MSQKTLKVAITVDTDSDCYFGDIGRKNNPADKKILGWDGLTKGMPLFVQQIQEIAEEKGITIPITWFVRCDGQIKQEHGTPAYLLERYASWWSDRIEAGDELQWHAHLYRYEHNIWAQETDPDRLYEDLKLSKAAFEKTGYAFTTIRIGESYFSNDLLDILESLDITSGSTAMPGRYRQDAEKSIDWRHTPNKPYQPSIADYRRDENPRRAFKEFPLNTVETQVSYDKENIDRYVNLSFHKGVLRDGLRSFMKNFDTLVSITHPFEIVAQFFKDKDEMNHPLLSFDPHSIKDNICTILEIAKEIGRPVEFIKISSLIKHDTMYG